MLTTRLKKVAISAVIVGVFIVYSLLHARSAPVALLPPPPATTGPAPSGSATSSPGATTSASSRYKDGTYTGGLADAQWGYVQVQATIQGGRITNVRFLQYPSDRSRSVEINSYADPQLINEAIQAQSAQVDIVTGATDSSDAFIQSLSDALSQAQA